VIGVPGWEGCKCARAKALGHPWATVPVSPKNPMQRKLVSVADVRLPGGLQWQVKQVGAVTSRLSLHSAPLPLSAGLPAGWLLQEILVRIAWPLDFVRKP